MISENRDIETRVFKIDPGHSNIGFKVRHMMMAKVNGRFEDYQSTLRVSEWSFENAQLDFTARTASINTNNEERDRHLRSPDFFNAAIHKKIKYNSSKIVSLKNNIYKVEGYLTMNGIKNYVELLTKFSGVRKDPKGSDRIALTMNGKIDRLTWNMQWNRPLESGGILVSREVKLIIECEFIGDENS